MNDEDLDSILDSALDDFEEAPKETPQDDGSEPRSSVSSTQPAKPSLPNQGPPQIPGIPPELPMPTDPEELAAVNELAHGMTKLFEELSKGGDMETNLADTLKALSDDTLNLPAVLDNIGKGSSSSAANRTGPSDDVTKNIADTLENLVNNAKEMENVGEDEGGEASEDMLNELLSQMNSVTGNQDFQGLLEGMMEKFMSKEVMYEPMKQLCELYPEWLEKNAAKDSTEEYAKVSNQYDFVKAIVTEFDKEPHSMQKIMELMQGMQDCGSPPPEIVEKLAPGLEFGADGMPNMPFPGGGIEDAKCTVM
eukprot:GFYU01003411.1.p1 GENE.GFYU01003411.1~~GFYU01003411.1.p1  ORF type:complete len:308 (+),score=98.52 GFYU01003411.1:95-1018(+)